MVTVVASVTQLKLMLSPSVILVEVAVKEVMVGHDGMTPPHPGNNNKKISMENNMKCTWVFFGIPFI